ncbi:unnamed protein product [Rodentolepis nana]|uniref:Protein kinase domain-containing protein n=1 Tax=Rodentolepis nana TaxID=102285 RepID=A0A0R3T394_RODNA|nr:unnamed protein product [Rodentolepis nana]
MIAKFEDNKQLIESLNIPEHCDFKDEDKSLGSGGYGEVILARRPQNKELVVLKCFKSQFETCLRPSVVREICALSQFNHPNVVKLLDICCEECILHGSMFPKFTIALEYCCCDLTDLLKNQVQYKAPHYKSIIQQILLGLQHIHSSGFIHRDLKLANVLIGRDGSIKVADFGLSRLKNQLGLYTPRIGTKRYRPPEVVLLLGRYDETFDIFSAGGNSDRTLAKSMVEMLGDIDDKSLPGSQRSRAYMRLFDGVRIASPIFKARMQMMGASSETINFATRLLAINPSNRPKASEALDDPYFVNDPQPDGNLLPLLPSRLRCRD